MSYRLLKRVLGESSLEKKCQLLFGACLFVLITGSFYWYGRSTSELVKESARERARGMVDTAILGVHFEKWIKGKGSTDEELVPALIGALPSRKYNAGLIQPVETGEYAPQDDFERNALADFMRVTPEEALAKDEPEFREQPRYIDGELHYVYIAPVRNTGNACIACHRMERSTVMADQGRMLFSAFGSSMELGGLVSVLRVVVPDRATQVAMRKNNAFLLGAAIFTVFLAMLASYAIIRYIIVKPLAHLRDVSDRISHGDTALRADLNTGDEFEKLATAFNRMLRQLGSNQDELKEVNGHLNVKVDELAQANMQLYEMNRLKSDFLATMSHELRTPLNAIIGFSDVLESIASLDEKQKRYVKNIRTSGKVLLEMINDILDLAKIESGKMDVRLSDFPIEQVVTAQCDMARPLTERKNIDLEMQFEPGLAEMFQDQAKVQQILNNLLSNAIKFTPEGGRIVVSTQRDEPDGLLLKVSDTGVGIALEDQVTIFEKFRQGKTVLGDGDAMTREYSGTGLGLSIVKELCKLLGGEITLESELGKGSTFAVHLPWTRSEQLRLDTGLTAANDDAVRQRRDSVRAMESPAATS